MQTAILTDTNSGITQQEGKELGIFVLPMPVIIENQTFLEGVDITNEKLYEAMKQHNNISSSQPSPGMLMELWDTILQEGYDEIVYIPMSSGLSGSCHSAMQFALDYDGRVLVVDNHRISVTLRESVLNAMRLAHHGYRAKEIKDFLEEHAYDASIYITVNSLEYLKKSGRVTPAGAALASFINLKPVLTIQGDKLDSFAKTRGIKQAETKMIEAVQRDRSTRFADIPDSQIKIDTAGTFEADNDAAAWCQLVQKAFPSLPVSYVPLPCSIACHVGMNAAGIGITRIL